MSANRDQSQKISFLFAVPRKSDEANNSPSAPVGIQRGEIIKTGTHRAHGYSPFQLLQTLDHVPMSEFELQLEENLKQIEQIQSRLRFMIQEIEELTQE